MSDHSKIVVRPSVMKFAEEMELKLRENDHKGGWSGCSLLWLQAKLTEEVGELGSLLVKTHYYDGPTAASQLFEQRHEIRRECADLANVAMMIAELAQIDDPDEPPF